MKILIISDAWAPQGNGVVRTLTSTIAELEKQGHLIHVVTPDQFNNLPCPTYPEIRLAIPFNIKLSLIIKKFQPDAIHIATEGPLGLYGRIVLTKKIRMSVLSGPDMAKTWRGIIAPPMSLFSPAVATRSDWS